MIADIVASVLIFAAVLPATAFPIIYSRSPWRKTLIGRALMTHALGMALLIDISVLYKLFGDDYFARDWVRNAVYLLVVAGSFMQTWALIKARRRHHPNINPEG